MNGTWLRIQKARGWSEQRERLPRGIEITLMKIPRRMSGLFIQKEARRRRRGRHWVCPDPHRSQSRYIASHRLHKWMGWPGLRKAAYRSTECMSAGIHQLQKRWHIVRVEKKDAIRIHRRATPFRVVLFEGNKCHIFRHLEARLPKCCQCGWFVTDNSI